MVCLLLAGGGYAYLRCRYGQIHKVKVAGLVATPHGAGGTLPPLNILTVGNNSRCVLDGAQAGAFRSW